MPQPAGAAGTRSSCITTSGTSIRRRSQSSPTFSRDGRMIPAVVQVTKMGLVFVFDRTTGEPVFGIDERPVPASDVPGEVASPTQPFPRKPKPLVPDRAGDARRPDGRHAGIAARVRGALLAGQERRTLHPGRTRPDAVVPRNHGRRDVVGRRLRSFQQRRSSSTRTRLAPSDDERGAGRRAASHGRAPALTERLRSFLGQPAAALPASTVGSAACASTSRAARSRGRCRSETSRFWLLDGITGTGAPNLGGAIVTDHRPRVHRRLRRQPHSRVRSALGTRTLARRPPSQRSRDSHHLPRRQIGPTVHLHCRRRRRALFESDFRRVSWPSRCQSSVDI